MHHPRARGWLLCLNVCAHACVCMVVVVWAVGGGGCGLLVWKPLAGQVWHGQSVALPGWRSETVLALAAARRRWECLHLPVRCSKAGALQERENHPESCRA